MQHDARQFDIEDAIEASNRTMKQLREAKRQELAAVADLLEKLYADAMRPGSALNRELAVRSGQRLVRTVFNRARDLAEHGAPPPHNTHPTRELVRHAGEAPTHKLITIGTEAIGVSFKFSWPVIRAHHSGVLIGDEVMAGAKFRAAYLKGVSRAKAGSYGEEGPASDPHNRLLIGEDAEKAAHEYHYVRRMLDKLGLPRVEETLDLLVLEIPPAGDDHPIKPIEYGRRLSKRVNDGTARAAADLALAFALEVLLMVYRWYDAEVARAERNHKPAVESELAKHRRVIPNSRVHSFACAAIEGKACTCKQIPA